MARFTSDASNDEAALMMGMLLTISAQVVTPSWVTTKEAQALDTSDQASPVAGSCLAAAVIAPPIALTMKNTEKAGNTDTIADVTKMCSSIASFSARAADSAAPPSAVIAHAGSIPPHTVRFSGGLFFLRRADMPAVANVVASALLLGTWCILAVVFRAIARDGLSRSVVALRNASPGDRKLSLIRAVAAPWFNIPTIAVLTTIKLKHAFYLKRVAWAFAPFFEASTGDVKKQLIAAAAAAAIASSTSAVVAFHFAEKSKDPVAAFDVAWGAGAAVAGACAVLSLGAFLAQV